MIDDIADSEEVKRKIERLLVTMPSYYEYGYLDPLAKSVDKKIEKMLEKMKPLTIKEL